MLRIIVADHHTQALWALSTMLLEEADFDLVGTAQNAEELLTLAEARDVDLILTDRELPGTPIRTLIERLHMIDPRPVVMVMSSRIEDGRKVLGAGADVFVSKGNEPYWLLDSLRRHAARNKSLDDTG